MGKKRGDVIKFCHKVVSSYLTMAFFVRTSEVPPNVLSNLNFAASSGVIRCNFF